MNGVYDAVVAAAVDDDVGGGGGDCCDYGCGCCYCGYQMIVVILDSFCFEVSFW